MSITQIATMSVAMALVLLGLQNGLRVLTTWIRWFLGFPRRAQAGHEIRGHAATVTRPHVAISPTH